MTFVENGRPDPDSKEAILQEMIAAAEQAFGREFTPDEVSIVRAFYDPIATYCASQQQDIAQVLDASQIDHADGQSLDMLAALIGVRRKDARAATTRLQFRHDSRVTRDYTIPEGTRVQTDSTNAIKFETDEVIELKLLDDFEGGDLAAYVGDTGAFSVQTGTVYDGSYALEGAAQTGKIVAPSNTVQQGSRYHYRNYLNSGAVSAFLFGVSSQSDYYRVVLDDPTGEVRIEVVENGSATEIASESTAVPTGEWLDIEIDWLHDAEFEVTVEDSSETEVVSVSGSETTLTYDEGGLGFESLDSSATKFWDNATTSRVSVGATATEEGAETNIGSDAAVILASSLSGVDEVTNPIPSSGGRDREPDDDFRVRAKDELAESLRATLPALITRLDGLAVTRSVTVIDNDTNSTDADGRPGHSFEAVVDVDTDGYGDVAQTILDTKAIGDTSVGGYAGSSVTRTLELSNGQQKDITFSTPTQVQIYVSVDVSKTEEYPGDEQVRDNIVQYIGGTLESGDNVDGELGVGNDVIYNQILEAVMDVNGVYDVTDLQVDTSSSPTGTSNISIADTEMANATANDGSLTINATDA